jgi:predicted DNA-binding protein
MVKLKTEDEYVDVLTTVRIERETDRQLKLTVKSLNIAQSTFIRQAIKTAIAAAGVV